VETKQVPSGAATDGLLQIFSEIKIYPLPSKKEPHNRATFIGLHASCPQWCCIKKSAKYDQNTNWKQVKQHAGDVALTLRKIDFI
jgi:hypothetical protein